MKSTPPLLLLLSSCLLATLAGADSFVDDASDDQISHHPGGRNLLQAETDNDDGPSSEPVGPFMGPRKFYDGEFLMELSGDIRVSVFNGAKHVATVELDRAAASVKGSQTSSNGSSYSVTLDWKSSQFSARSGNAVSMQGIIIKMSFSKRDNGKAYEMTGLAADHIILDGMGLRDVELRAKSTSDYDVSAPIGSAFDCADPGMFAPQKRPAEGYSVGLTFPGMKLQVWSLKNGDNFGPSWECGSIFTIGLWVGLIVTLLFAFVCFWGFSMLASIQTMDRFDDPQGKPIHVPNTE